MIIFFFCLLATAQTAPAPFEMPLSELPAYFKDYEKDANPNPFPYDSYGAPPDHYPAIIPDIPVPDYYEDNSSYPGLYDDKECHSVKNCPGDPSDPYAPISAGSDFLGFGFNSDEVRTWKCNVEVDCFGQNSIPSDLSNDTEVLFLRSFDFTTLEVGNLSVVPPLVKLRISYSDLKTIEPGAFASQPTLQFLELVGNFITAIAPLTFIDLADLKFLDLTDNKIKEISRGTFEGLDSMTELKVSSNSLSELADYTFRAAVNLEEIILDDNNITAISKYAFSGLTKLKALHLNLNKLTAVPTASLRQPPALTELRLTGNPLGTILRNDFKGMAKLEEIWLNECELKSIARRAFPVKQIKVLVLSDNYLTSIPNLGKMKKLQTVLMDFNPWICNCDMVSTNDWLKRNDIGSESQDPRCTAPEHLAGRRSLELTDEDLCSPPPVPTLTMHQGTERYPTNDTENKNDNRKNAIVDEDTLPEGGWSNNAYDTKKLYTAVDLDTPAPSTRMNPTLPHTRSIQNPEMTVSSSEVSSKDTQARYSSTLAPVTRGRVHQTSPGFAREKTSVNGAITGTTSELPRRLVTTQSKATIGNKITLASTMRPKGTKPPGATTPTYAFPVAIILILLVLVLAVFLAKLWQARKNEKSKERQLELTPPNGERSIAFIAKPNTDQNGNDTPRPTNKLENGFIENMENEASPKPTSEKESESLGSGEDDASPKPCNVAENGSLQSEMATAIKWLSPRSVGSESQDDELGT